FVLNLITVYSFPQGGSITAASMLPIFLVAYLYGPWPGCATGLVFGVLHVVYGKLFYLTFPQFALEYLVAFGVLGVCGFFRKSWAWWLCGIGVACALRFGCHVLAGIVFWAEYAPEGVPVWWYSISYNGAYMAIETAVCIALAFGILKTKALDRLLHR
ncbi:MAG: energy-coupled thiamine transporter ThiT, partial [Clostridia bacterium]|nr:energy-coupled thiamine transporter ThiT [Clostridia bacterium]